VTWSADGTTQLPWFAGLSGAEQSAGMTFCNLQPSAFIVAHVDYVRSVHVMPLGPEQTQLTVNWMLRPDTLASGSVDMAALTAVGHQLVAEDARACELNQKGLHSLRHEHGVLAPQEYDVLAFDDWATGWRPAELICPRAPQDTITFAVRISEPAYALNCADVRLHSG
jgi:Rieske 2Fe-2S family protein